MKIGIHTKDLNTLSYWELKILKEIFLDSKWVLSLVIIDTKCKSYANNNQHTFVRWFPQFNLVTRLILKFQKYVEQKLFFRNNSDCNKELLNLLKSIPRFNLEHTTHQASKELKKQGLDLILSFSAENITEELLSYSNYGIWSLSYSEPQLNRRSLIGFWEVLLKEEYATVTLQKILGTNEFQIIEKAHVNRSWSYIETKYILQVAANSLLIKNLTNFSKNNCLLQKTSIYPLPLFKLPSIGQVLSYLITFYLNVLRKIAEKIISQFTGRRYSCWTLFIGKGNFLDTNLFKLKPIHLPKNEFWADPFLFEYNEEHYVFFENFSYKTKKGKISCGKIINNEIHEVIDVLDLNYHLSYPYIFQEDGEIFLMPETSENEKLEIYRCVKFPSKWELYTTAFEGERVVDGTFYTDVNKQKWLFVNKQKNSLVPFEIELYIYKVASVKLNVLEPHTQNPVLIDARSARNGGAVFEYEGNCYRPSQRNIEGIYGRALNINKIETLTLTEYKERNIKVIKPNFYNGLISIHHIHQIRGLFVFDAAYKSL